MSPHITKCELSNDSVKNLIDCTKLIMSDGKGILAADESTGTIKKRFDMINLENTEENRVKYRNLLFTTPLYNQYISGAILFEETLFQNDPNGKPFVEILKENKIIIGIKVDTGLELIPNTDEYFTKGLDTLSTRCKKYYEAGARFAKWRSVISIDLKTSKPSMLSINTVCDGLAKYASVCQANGLVPIVEPEILADGDHSIETCAIVTEKVLSVLFKSLYDHGVVLEGTILKINMVTPGFDSKNKSSSQEIAYFTTKALLRTVPPALGGIVFLSGGQSEADATVNLNSINRLGSFPWKLSFSYGRALQASCIKTWAGKTDNVSKAQQVFLQRAKENSMACLGEFNDSEVEDASKDTLFEKRYVY
ncbi:fructose-bisphosphate aldolase, class I [Babesia microti strain RI]|uniref:fructose-bisphosphate aldolase n=1 Tax=Babesia microti (strain RI) TaxID=1133968 RepID=A0A1R4ABL6_BABMR|nr:fructose-bisphosphate aldolase, class I [Babesia microti strain RI]SJK86388.1 fructose-bisphosphate aldolase, class I [Babesia microti strain RI]|eukprot:XP_021338550.1 fructose-bisphosphate aldolase, class I [Babesia microti strain RI]